MLPSPSLHQQNARKVFTYILLQMMIDILLQTQRIAAAVISVARKIILRRLSSITHMIQWAIVYRGRKRWSGSLCCRCMLKVMVAIVRAHRLMKRIEFRNVVQFLAIERHWAIHFSLTIRWIGFHQTGHLPLGHMIRGVCSLYRLQWRQLWPMRLIDVVRFHDVFNEIGSAIVQRRLNVMVLPRFYRTVCWCRLTVERMVIRLQTLPVRIFH